MENLMTDYFSHPAINISKLKDLKRSPKYFWAKHIAKIIEERPREEFIFGSAFHSSLLEIEKFLENYLFLPKIDKRTKEFSELKSKFPNSIILENKDKFDINNMLESLKSKKTWQRVSEYFHHKEMPIFWTDPVFQEECKLKFDIWIEPNADYPYGLLIDIKTSIDACKESFIQSLYKFGYYNQVAWYCEGLRNKYNLLDYPEFLFIVVEKVPPYDCSFFMADMEMLEYGLRENYQLLEKYKICKDIDIWHGYDDKIENISLPKWAINKMIFEGK